MGESMAETTKFCRVCDEVLQADISKCPNCGTFDLEVEFCPLNADLLEDFEQSAVDHLHYN